MNRFFDIEDRVSEEVSFHPTSTPRGLEYYKPNVLSEKQQKLLNKLKVNMMKENETYLHKHPEIRAIISLLLTKILKQCTYFNDIGYTAAKFFDRPRCDIEKDIEEYLKRKGRHADLLVHTESKSNESVVLRTYKPYEYSSYSEKSDSHGKNLPTATFPIGLFDFDKIRSQLLKYFDYYSISIQGESGTLNLLDLLNKDQEKQKKSTNGSTTIQTSELNENAISTESDYMLEMENDEDFDLEKYEKEYKDIFGEYEDEHERQILKSLNEMLRKQKRKTIKIDSDEEVEENCYLQCIC